MNATLSLPQVIAVNLTCLEQGLDSKAAVQENILKAVAQHHAPAPEPRKPEDFPAELFQMLHDRFGLAVEVHDGRITGVSIERTASPVGSC